MNKIFIGNLGFRTQKSAIDYTRNIIDSIGCGNVKSDHHHFRFFCELIKNHSESYEKIGCGVDYFEICKNKQNCKYYHTNIIRLDGTSIDFSWNNCAGKKSNDPRKNLKNAMREHVTDDIIKFRKNSNLICKLCGVVDDVEFHVDHDNPSFMQLYDSFLETNKLTIPTSFDDNTYYQAKFKNIDLNFAENWYVYHKENANLQILCKTCNLKKPK